MSEAIGKYQRECVVYVYIQNRNWRKIGISVVQVGYVQDRNQATSEMRWEPECAVWECGTVTLFYL